MDWLVPTHICEGDLLYLVYRCECKPPSTNTLTDKSRNHVLPVIWASLSLAKLTHNINHYLYDRFSIWNTSNPPLSISKPCICSMAQPNALYVDTQFSASIPVPLRNNLFSTRFLVQLQMLLLGHKMSTRVPSLGQFSHYRD